MSPRQSPSNAAASPKSGAPSFELPEMPTSSNWLLGLFALAIVGLVGFWAWLRFGDKLPINHPLRKKTANVLTLQPIGEVSTREDVVRAFHILSSRLVSAVQPWWTHRAVADWLWKSSPSVSEPMRDMAEIYEHARYLPADSNLTMDEVERAKRAIHQCEHATS